MKKNDLTIEVVEKLFEKNGVSSDFFKGIEKAIKNETHVSHWKNIFLRYDDGSLASDLVKTKKLMDIKEYQNIFPKYRKGLVYQKYSPVLEALMIVSNFKFCIQECKSNAKVIADYINNSDYNLSDNDKFESFTYIAKYINWPMLIKKNMKFGNFGNNISHKYLSESIENIFLAKRRRSPYYPGGYYIFLVLIAYGIFADEDFYYRILERDVSLTISDDEVRGLIKWFYIEDFEHEDYKVMINQYGLQSLPEIAYLSFSLFKTFLNDFSDEFKLLARLA